MSLLLLQALVAVKAYVTCTYAEGLPLYVGCTNITNGVQITFSPTSSPLPFLGVVEISTLTVRSCCNITMFNFSQTFPNLTRITQNLQITNNPSLPSITIPPLVILGKLIITNNPSLSVININNHVSAGGGLTLTDNPLLSSFPSLPFGADADIILSNNINLINIDFNDITQLDTLTVTNSPSLSLSLPSLTNTSSIAVSTITSITAPILASCRTLKVTSTVVCFPDLNNVNTLWITSAPPFVPGCFPDQLGLTFLTMVNIPSFIQFSYLRSLTTIVVQNFSSWDGFQVRSLSSLNINSNTVNTLAPLSSLRALSTFTCDLSKLQSLNGLVLTSLYSLQISRATLYDVSALALVRSNQHFDVSSIHMCCPWTGVFTPFSILRGAIMAQCILCLGITSQPQPPTGANGVVTNLVFRNGLPGNNYSFYWCNGSGHVATSISALPTSVFSVVVPDSLAPGTYNILLDPLCNASAMGPSLPTDIKPVFTVTSFASWSALPESLMVWNSSMDADDDGVDYLQIADQLWIPPRTATVAAQVWVPATVGAIALFEITLFLVLQCRWFQVEYGDDDNDSLPPSQLPSTEKEKSTRSPKITTTEKSSKSLKGAQSYISRRRSHARQVMHDVLPMVDFIGQRIVDPKTKFDKSVVYKNLFIRRTSLGGLLFILLILITPVLLVAYGMDVLGASAVTTTTSLETALGTAAALSTSDYSLSLSIQGFVGTCVTNPTTNTCGPTVSSYGFFGGKIQSTCQDTIAPNNDYGNLRACQITWQCTGCNLALDNGVSVDAGFNTLAVRMEWLATSMSYRGRVHHLGGAVEAGKGKGFQGATPTQVSLSVFRAELRTYSRSLTMQTDSGVVLREDAITAGSQQPLPGLSGLNGGFQVAFDFSRNPDLVAVSIVPKRTPIAIFAGVIALVTGIHNAMRVVNETVLSMYDACRKRRNRTEGRGGGGGKGGKGGGGEVFQDNNQTTEMMSKYPGQTTREETQYQKDRGGGGGGGGGELSSPPLSPSPIQPTQTNTHTHTTHTSTEEVAVPL